MRRLITVAFVFGCLTLSGRPSAAQDQPPPLPSTPFVVPALRAQHQPLSADQERELQQWVQDKAAWDHQQKRWQNGPAHNNYGKIVQRKSEPEPPAWLGRVLHDGGRDPDRCARPDDRTSVRRCCDSSQSIPRRKPFDSAPRPSASTRRKCNKSSFFSRVHLDGLWSTTSTDLRDYGLVGSHISLVDVGRVQFFGPPGILLLRMPDVAGSHQIRVGYTWGLSVRLVDLKLFGRKRTRRCSSASPSAGRWGARPIS